jgi:hypothetical protein
VDVGGWWLSDDPALPDKHVLAPGSRIRAGAYLILLADGDIEEGRDHLNFSLDRDGESIVLTDLEGRRESFEIPAGAASDFSYMRVPDCCVGDCWQSRSNGTPGATNGAAVR